jgi:uncharacterized protein (TIGR02678 family)
VTEVELHVQTERQQAARALLQRPLLGADTDLAAFALVRRHQAWLRDRFEHLLGYRLAVRTDHARLHKRASRVYRDRHARVQPASIRPGPEDGWAAFTRRHYVLLALLLAALEAHAGRSQALIGTLAGEAAAVGAELGIPVDFARREERKALAEALELLVRLGALRQRDGSTAAFVGADETREEALFDIDRGRLGDLRAGPTALAEVTRADELLSTGEDYPATEDGRRARRRHRICRVLVEDPVLYVDDLAQDERDTYRSQRHRLEPELETLTGLSAERRAEGSALVDPTRRLSDVRFPTRALESQLAVVLCERLRSLVRERGRNPLPRAEVQGELAALRERFAVDGPELDRGALALLIAHDLLREEGAHVRVMPATARFAQPTIRESGSL